jgi:hypothetical protein
MVTDGQGLPIAVEVTAGQIHDSTRVESIMGQINNFALFMPKS